MRINIFPFSAFEYIIWRSTLQVQPRLLHFGFSFLVVPHKVPFCEACCPSVSLGVPLMGLSRALLLGLLPRMQLNYSLEVLSVVLQVGYSIICLLGSFYWFFLHVLDYFLLPAVHFLVFPWEVVVLEFIFSLFWLVVDPCMMMDFVSGLLFYHLVSHVAWLLLVFLRALVCCATLT